MRSSSRLQSLFHASRGLKTLFAGQANARIHLAVALVVTGLGGYLRISALEWALLALTMALVLCAEALNTAIELVVDLASPEWHALARDAKDVAAAAVLIASLGAVVVGSVVFWPRLF